MMALSGCSSIFGGSLFGDGPHASVSETAAMRLAETTRTAGDPQVAVGIYRRAHELRPNDPAPLVGLGDSLLALGRADLAVDSYRQALALEPGEPAGLRGLGMALISLDRPAEAVTAFDKLLAKDPQNVPALVARGVAQDLVGTHRDAQASYLAALAIAPDHTSARNNLALSLALTGQYEEATQMFERLIGEGKAPPAARNLALVQTLENENSKLVAQDPANREADAKARNLAALAVLKGAGKATSTSPDGGAQAR